MSEGSVEVNPIDLFLYGGDVEKNALQHLKTMGESMDGVVANSVDALTTAPANSSPFAEGINVVRVIERNLNNFHAFMNDVKNGMDAIRCASAAIAVAYATCDQGSADSLNSVDFAFADGGKPPKGFPTDGVQTLDDQRRAAADAAGGNTTAAMAATNTGLLSFATSQHAEPGAYVYAFADGSVLRVSTGMGGKVTTVYDNKPGAASIVTETYNTGSNGASVKSKKVETRTADGRYTSTSTSVERDSAGNVTVTTKMVDAQGHETTATTHANAAPTDPDADTPKGELEKREEEYDAKGDPKNFKQLGAS